MQDIVVSSIFDGLISPVNFSQVVIETPVFERESIYTIAN